MGILDLFRTTPTWSVEKAKDFLEKNDLSQYEIVDVRGEEEYEHEHLPGAKLIPVGELSERLDELDPNKTIITY